MREFEIKVGNALDVLRGMESESVQCCVTSPPYLGLRDYKTEPLVWGGNADCQHVWGNQIPGSNRGGSGTPTDKNNRGEDYARAAVKGCYCELCQAWRGSLGLEPTPAMLIEHLVWIFREVRRVLRNDGTVWVNIGDSYAGSWGAQSRGNLTGEASSTLQGGSMLSARQIMAHPKETGTGSMKNTPGCKPKDLIGIPWMLAFALRADGWYLRSEIIWSKVNPMPESVTDRPTKAHEQIFLLAKSQRYFYDAAAIAEPSVTNDERRPYTSKGAWQMDGRPESMRHGGELRGKTGANAFRGQGHFRAGVNGPANRDGRDMKDVGAGLTRNKRTVWTVATKSFQDAHFATFPPDLIEPCILAGSREGDLTLDPFSGAGTTGLVALRLGRRYVGIELSLEYAEMSRRRITGDAPLLNREIA